MKKYPLKNNFVMPYKEQLENERWIKKVEEIKCILESCQTCGKANDLHVHHKKYIEGKKAWEYENNDLDLLCSDCHLDEHYSNGVPVFDANGKQQYLAIADLDELLKFCSRCGGEGIIPLYMHVQNGICFKCWGKKFFNIDNFNTIYVT